MRLVVLNHRHWISRHTFCNDHLDQQSHKRRLHEWNSVTGLSMEYLPTIGSDVAIWLANLRLSVRVRTMLLASTCHAMPILAVKHGWFTRITWHRCCGKKQIDSCLVWSLLLSTTIFAIKGVKICCGFTRLLLMIHNILTAVTTNIVVDKS